MVLFFKGEDTFNNSSCSDDHERHDALQKDYEGQSIQSQGHFKLPFDLEASKLDWLTWNHHHVHYLKR